MNKQLIIKQWIINSTLDPQLNEMQLSPGTTILGVKLIRIIKIKKLKI